MRSKVRGLVFDLHGVLVRFYAEKDYRRAVSRYFPKEIFADLKRKYGTGAMVFTVMGKKEDYIRILNSLPVRCRREPEIVRLLTELRKKVPLYIATDTTKRNCLRSLAVAGYPTSLFDRILTIDDVDRPKPDPEIFRRLGVGPGFVVFGDNRTDVIPALELGAEGIVVRSRKELIRELKRMLSEIR